MSELNTRRAVRAIALPKRTRDEAARPWRGGPRVVDAPAALASALGVDRLAISAEGPGPAADGARLDATIGGREATLTLADDRAFARARERVAGFDPREMADPAARALGLEAALMEEIEAIEAAIGAEIRLQRLHLDASDAAAEAALFGAPGAAAAGQRRLRIAPADDPAWPLCDITLPAALADRLWRASVDPTPSATREAGVGAVLAACVAEMSVARTALESLEVGDALVTPLETTLDRAVLSLAGRWRARARLIDDGRAAEILEPFQAVRRAERWEDEMGGDWNEPGQRRALDPNAIDALPVALTVEAGRASVSVASLRELGVGDVVPLEAAADAAATLLANGRVFARGRLVDLDGRLAFEIEALGDG